MATLALMPAREKRKIISDVRRLIGKGYTDEEILEEMDIRSDTLRLIKHHIYKIDKMTFENLDNATVYSDYIFKCQQMIRDLDEMKVKFRNRGQWTALVASVKTKKEILDGVIKMGQEFGYISKKATELKMSGEISMTAMSTKDMKAEIAREVESLNKLAKGKAIEMRQELLGVTDQELKKFLPANVVHQESEAPRKKIKTKLRVSLKKMI